MSYNFPRSLGRQFTLDIYIYWPLSSPTSLLYVYLNYIVSYSIIYNGVYV